MTWWKTRWIVGALGLPAMLACGLPAKAQVSVQIGVNFSNYPRLVRVPNYPVYYSPGAPANLFFYDGLYWLYLDDGWYTSSWYNGPWSWVDPFEVPVFVLRVPVRYYAVPPPYFRAWRADAPPHWGEHWGPDWDRRHPGWNRWDPRRAPPPAPLPVYQRPYAGDRYPSPHEQRRLQERQYRYQPREPVARAHLAAPVVQPLPQPAERPMPAPAREMRPPRADREMPPPQQHQAPVVRREAPAPQPQQMRPPEPQPRPASPMPTERRVPQPQPQPRMERPEPPRGGGGASEHGRPGPGTERGPGPGAGQGQGRGRDEHPAGGRDRERER